MSFDYSRLRGARTLALVSLLIFLPALLIPAERVDAVPPARAEELSDRFGALVALLVLFLGANLLFRDRHDMATASWLEGTVVSEPVVVFEPLAQVRCLVVIVTHNSELSLQWCLDGLDSSASNIAVRIVDSGSHESSYLDRLHTRHPLEVRKAPNIGFVAANNAALGSIGIAQWVLFLNPDARVEGADLDRLFRHAENPVHEKTAIFTVPLIRFDITAFRPLDRYDSVGIGSTWYGRWVDRLSGRPVQADNDFSSGDWPHPEAICGAFMLVRATALLSVPDSTGSYGFERRYYMYKEDIELSLRLRDRGWRLALVGHLHAYHCRGWNKSRGSVPYWARLESSRNDVDVARRYAWRSLPFALAKYLYVKTLERG